MTDSTMNGITVAICTRNRPAELEYCVRCLARQDIVKSALPVEVLVVDDGDLTETQREQLQATLPSWMDFRYYRKRRPGLFFSRIEAGEAARYDVILFIDDDTELFPDYLQRLAAHYVENRTLAALGGVDQFIRSSFAWRVFARCILFSSGKPGKLSMTGYGGSMVYWPKETMTFPSEFLSGCNMSYRREVLIGMQPCRWMLGYSLGEDLYLSHRASGYGQVLVDPHLRVLHHQAPTSRDRQDEVAQTEIVNHHFLLLNRGASILPQLLHLWTAAGLWAWSLRSWRENEPKRRGYRRGIARISWEMRRNFAKRWRG